MHKPMEHLGKLLLAAGERHIEYGGFLSNHAVHGLIALHRIGASPAQLDRAWAAYSEKLEPPHALQERRLESRAAVLALAGRTEPADWPLLREYFCRTAPVVADWKELLPGGIGALFHAGIHLGYALDADHRESVQDALAYHVYAQLRVVPDSDAAYWGSLERRSAEDLYSFLRSPRCRELVPAVEERIEASADLQAFRKRRGIYQAMIAAVGRDVAEGIRGFADPRDIFAVAVRLYVEAEHNDFFLLHGITASWALAAIAERVPEVGQDDALMRRVSAELISAFGAVFIGQGAPERHDPPAAPALTWDEFRARALGKLDESAFTDEHVFKLVHVAADASERGWPVDEELLKQAAHKVTSEEFFFN